MKLVSSRGPVGVVNERPSEMNERAVARNEVNAPARSVRNVGYFANLTVFWCSARRFSTKWTSLIANPRLVCNSPLGILVHIDAKKI